MGAPGYTVFCKNGHIVQIVQNHEIVKYHKVICPVCGSNETYKSVEWGDPEYGPHCVPYEPVRTEETVQRVRVPVTTPVYDISRVPEWNVATPNQRRTCRKCGDVFVLFGSEVDFYNRKNLPLPKRCRQCRKDARLEKITEGEDKE